MYHYMFIFIQLHLLACDIAALESKANVLSRKKRYVVFPEGSTLSVAICLTSQTILPTEIFTEGLNWGISYDLPNDSSTFRNFIRPKHVMQRRHRRDLYNKIEIIMDSMGFNGKACIFRTLCETARRFVPNGNSLIEELIRIVFKFPLNKILNSEPEEHRLYHWAYRIGNENQEHSCTDLFPVCPFSLLELALGEYSDSEQQFPYNEP